MDDDHCYRAVQSRDGRFDGAFFGAVRTTGIYCRPSCPAITPKRQNMRFFASAAAAQQAGFRACKRCRPDAAPGSPEWNVRADLVGRAMRLIADGLVERDGVAGLARQLNYSERQLHRQMVAELGAGPLALARAYRVQSARALLETTDLAVSDVAFAAGFGSIRQFNDTVRTVFALTPTELRHRAARHQPPPRPGLVRVRLAYREPLAWEALLAFLAVRAIPGVEECRPGEYRRVLSLPHGSGVVAIRKPAVRPGSAGRAGGPAALDCELRLDDHRDLTAAVQRARRLLDLDADPVAVDGVLGADERLGPVIAAGRGRRVPGTVDGAELAVRALLGQQVSLAAARTLGARLTVAHGRPLPQADGRLTHAFPTVEALADADPAGWPMPASRQRALGALAAAVANEKIALHPGADRDQTETALHDLPGIGPWTAGYVRMRALGDPDVFLAGDLGIRKALAALGAPSAADAWRPWRSYAMQYLWATAAPTPSLTSAERS